MILLGGIIIGAQGHAANGASQLIIYVCVRTCCTQQLALHPFDCLDYVKLRCASMSRASASV